MKVLKNIAEMLAILLPIQLIITESLQDKGVGLVLSAMASGLAGLAFILSLDVRYNKL